MRAVKDRNTAPELRVRRLCHKLGYRFRLHRKDLPGKPDLVFPARKKIIFVNGCFWHGHRCKRGARLPGTNLDYWRRKISRNSQRDCEISRALRKLGWDVLTVWECETRSDERLTISLRNFLTKSARRALYKPSLMLTDAAQGVGATGGRLYATGLREPHQ